MDDPLINSPTPAEPSKPRGRPFQPGQSGNPRGRPKGSNALAQAIREKVPPETLIGVALTVMRDGASRDKIAAAQLLASFGWTRPEQRHELVMGQPADDEEEQLLLEQCTTPELERLRAIEAERETILDAARARRQLPEGSSQ